MLKIAALTMCCVALLAPSTLLADVEVERLLDIELGAPVLDVTTNPEDDLVYFLTPGTVLIYSNADQAVLDRVPVEAAFDRIAYQGDDRLVLTDSDSPRIMVLRFSRVYAIDITGRAVKGPDTAKVTLAVFDDYQ